MPRVAISRCYYGNVILVLIYFFSFSFSFGFANYFLVLVSF